MGKHRQGSPAFTVSDLARRANDVQHAANANPVVLTHHGKERYVLLTVEEYKRLSAPKIGKRQAFDVKSLPKKLKADLMQGINDYLSERD